MKSSTQEECALRTKKKRNSSTRLGLTQTCWFTSICIVHKRKVKGLCKWSDRPSTYYSSRCLALFRYYVSLWMIVIEPMLICCHWSATLSKMCAKWSDDDLIRKFPSKNLSHMRTEVIWHFAHTHSCNLRKSTPRTWLTLMISANDFRMPVKLPQ